MIHQPTIRASSLNIAYYCDGAPKAMAGFKPVGEVVEYLKKGKDAHKWIENKINDVDQSVNDDMESFWQWWQLESPIKDPIEQHTEHKVKYTINGIDITGTIDLLSICKDCLFITDWKHGEGQKYILPKITENIQMLAYAVLVFRKYAKIYNIKKLIILVVLISEREIQKLELGPEEIDSAESLIYTIAESATKNPDNRVPGSHCENCLARQNCMEYRDQTALIRNFLVDTEDREIVFNGEQAIRYALARSALKTLVEKADLALKSYLESGGKVESGSKRLALTGGNRDSIMSHERLIKALEKDLGIFPWPAIKTSKKAILDTMKAAGLDKDDYNEFIDHMRDSELIVNKEISKSIRWVKK